MIYNLNGQVGSLKSVPQDTVQFRQRFWFLQKSPKITIQPGHVTMPRRNGISRRTKPCHGRPPTKRARHNESGAPVRQGIPTDANMQLLEEVGKTTSLLTSVDDIAPELKARIYEESLTYGQQLAYQEMRNQ
jgi:hypothetical protein